MDFTHTHTHTHTQFIQRWIREHQHHWWVLSPFQRNCPFSAMLLMVQNVKNTRDDEAEDNSHKRTSHRYNRRSILQGRMFARGRMMMDGQELFFDVFYLFQFVFRKLIEAEGIIDSEMQLKSLVWCFFLSFIVQMVLW